MKTERSNVEFPLWRKKVDKSLFEHKGTTVPLWACRMWNLPSYFQHVNSKKDPDAQVTIRYAGKLYKGSVTVAKQGRSSPAYRLWFEDNLAHELKYTFLMSYMRSLEQSLTIRVLRVLLGSDLKIAILTLFISSDIVQPCRESRE